MGVWLFVAVFSHERMRDLVLKDGGRYLQPEGLKARKKSSGGYLLEVAILPQNSSTPEVK